MIRATKRLFPVALLIALAAAYASAEARANTHISRRIVEVPITVEKIVEVPITADKPDLSPEEAAKVPLSGAWEVAYSDRNLGFVEGEAIIREEDGRAKVVFYHPRTGREFTLQSRSFSRNGGKVVIEFEGRQPGSEHEDGQRYPERALVVAEETAEVSVSVGANKATTKINPRKPSDLDTVRVELTVFGRTHMRGRWLYRADPAIQRDRAGYGRVDQYTEDENGNGQQSGGEVWVRPRTIIYGAVTIQDQASWIDGIAGNPYPFKPKHLRRGPRYRTLLVFGENLPEDPDEGRAIVKSLSEKISYGGIYYISQAARLPQVDYDYRKGVKKVWDSLKKYLTADANTSRKISASAPSAKKKKESAAHSRILRDLPPKAREMFKNLDFLIVTASLKPDVLPGYHAFELNGATHAWQLAFGDNWAGISFVRENSRYKPVAIECYMPQNMRQREDWEKRLREDRRMETTKDLFIREKIQVEVNTNIKLDLNEIPVFVYVGDQIWKFGASPYLMAKRVPGKPCTYLTEPFWLVPVYKPTKPPTVPEELETEEIGERETAVAELLKELGLKEESANAEASTFVGKGWDVKQATVIAAWLNRVPPDRVMAATNLTREEIAGVLDAYNMQNGTTETATRNRLAGEYLGTDVRVPSSKVVVGQGTALSATIAEPGLFSLRIPTATAKVRLGPGVAQILPGWKQALLDAAACRGLTGLSLEELTVQDPATFLERYKNLTNYGIFVDDWITFLAKLTPAGQLLFASDDTIRVELFNTEVMLGDLAAMMLLRTTFVQMMLDVDIQFSQFNEDWELLAFRRYIEPVIWKRDYGIGELKVEDTDGSPIYFSSTFGDYGLDEVEILSLKKGEVELTDKQRWALDATRKAIAKYREVMRESRLLAEKIDPCDDIQDLIELTGRSFYAVEARVRPRMMRLSSAPTAGGPVWTPDYVARGHLDRVGVVYNVLKLNEVKASQDDSGKLLAGVMIATAIVSIPLLEAGGTAAMIANVLFNADLAYIVYGEMEHAWRSQKEIAFAEGAIEVLGHERLDQARKEEYSFISAFTASGFYVAADKLVMAQVAEGVFFLAHAGWQKATRFWRMKRAKGFFKKSLKNVGKEKDIFSELSAKEFEKLAKGLGEYLEHANHLQRAGKALDDTQIDALTAFKKSDLAQTVMLGKKPKWAARVDGETFDMLKPMLGRGDVHALMNDAAETVMKALKAGGREQEEALSLLIHTPQRTGADFERALRNRLKIDKGHKGARYMDQADATDAQSVRMLDDANWKFELYRDGNSIELSVTGPKGKKASIDRAYDPDTGTLSLVAAFREEVPAWIKAGLDVPLVAGKGVPTIQFMTLRIMRYFKIGFRGTGQAPLNFVEMKHIANARTILQVRWLRDKYFPGKSLRQLANNPEFGKLLAETRSIQYARSVIEVAGYEIDGPVILSFEKSWYGPTKVRKAMAGFKQGSDGETASQFFKRFGFEENQRVDEYFNMKFKVKPAANDNIPPSTQTPRPPGHQTAKLPRTDTEPMGRPPASNDNFGGSPPPGDGPPVGPGGGDEPLYMARVAQLRQQAEQQAQEALARYRAHARGELQLTKDQLDEIFWVMHDRDTLQGGLEQAVSAARRAGVPDDVVAQHVAAYANSLSGSARVNAVRAMERAHLRKNGYRVLTLGDTEAEMINRIVTNTQTGRATAEELAFLRQRIAAARARGRDYFDDLARTGSMTPDEPFELLANAAEIRRLRALAKREDLYSGTSQAGSEAAPPLPRQQGGRPPPKRTNRSQEETRTMRRPDSSGGTQRIPLDMPPSAEADMRRRLAPLGPLPLQHALRTAGAMQRLGVPEELARELVALNAVRLANPGTQSLNRVVQAQLIAEGIMKHGTRRVPLKEFAQAIGVPKSIAEVAAEVAAIRGGYAPLPSEIRPGWLYPAYH